MASDLWNIFLNIVASFVYAGIVWLWKNRGSRPSLTVSHSPIPKSEDEVPADRRTQNLRAFERATHRFLFYLVTFGVLYFSVTLPPLLKAQFANSQVLLSDARNIGEFLPSIPVSKDYLQVAFFITAAVLYWPLLFLAEVITSMLYPIIDSIYRVTYRIWSAVTMFVFLGFCIPIAATSIWLFYEKTFQQAITTVLIVLFLMFALGQSQGGKK